MGLSLNPTLTKNFKNCTGCCYVRCVTFILRPKTAQFITMHNQDVKTKVVQSKCWLSALVEVLVPSDLLNGLALSCYQPSPQLLISLINIRKLTYFFLQKFLFNNKSRSESRSDKYENASRKSRENTRRDQSIRSKQVSFSIVDFF